jgi:hypothetical protein
VNLCKCGNFSYRHLVIGPKSGAWCMEVHECYFCHRVRERDKTHLTKEQKAFITKWNKKGLPK